MLASWWGLLALPPGYLLVANFGPALAAATLTLASGGTPALEALLAGLFRWRVGIQWYAFALLAPPGVWGVALGAHVLLGGRLADLSERVPWYVVLPALALGVVHEAGEELGWRGYVLPRLLARYRPLAASFIVAALWGGWHLPAFWAQGDLAGGLPLGWWWLALVAYAILFTWLYLRSGGSLLLAALFHAAINMLPAALPAPLAGPEAWRPYALQATLWTALALAVTVAGLSRGTGVASPPARAA